MYMAVLGPIYLLLTFVFCFVLVHVIKLAAAGFTAMKKKKEPKPVEKPAPKKSEPVYYIVEKKRARRSYSQPREIEFKK